MEKLTFLAPADPTINQITKTYRKTASGIDKESDYNAGFLFNYAIEKVNSFKDLPSVLERYCGTHFRIYGEPEPNLVPPCRRLKEHFSSKPAGYCWHMLDIDNWKVSPELFQLCKPDPSDPDSIASLVRALLNNAGLGFLATVDLVILLSASQFDDFSTLNAHIYFQLETPVTLSEMRNIALAFNKGKTFKVFDHQVYKSVQPDYISKPICTNFKDPLKKRIFFDESPFGIDKVSTSDWNQFKKEAEKNVGHTIDASTKPPRLGRNWIETLNNHVGTTDGGINEPCYRAAAQMVQEYGKATIIGNMDHYVQRLYKEAWRCIDDRGHRSTHADKQKYDLAKFRGYVKSACDKNFGTEADDWMSRVDDAIEEAKQGNYQPIFDSYVLNAAAQLRSKHTGLYSALRIKLKTDLARKVTLGDWERKVTEASYAPVEDYKSLLPGGNKADSGAAGAAASPVIDIGQAKNKMQAENRLMMQIMKDYDLILDQEGIYHLGKEPDTKDGRYQLHPITNEIAEFLYYKATLLTNGSVSKDFGIRCMQFIRGAIDSTDTVFKRIETTVGGRNSQEGPDPRDPCWLNVGDEDGQPQKCLRISDSGVKWYPCEETDVKWRSGFAKLDILSEREFNQRFKGSNEALIRYFYSNIGRYIASTGDSRVHVAAWCVAAIMGRPMPYLAELIGPKQSGKSTAAIFMKDLVDPDGRPIEEPRGLNKFKKTDSDFFNKVYSQMVTIFDNVSKLSADDQDSLCGTATGITYSERILYSHKRRNLYIKRPIILTGIDDVVTRSDLNSRTLKISFGGSPKPSLDLYKNWNEQAPVFRRAIIEITHQVIKRYSRLTSADIENVKPRDLVFALVTKILRPDDQRSIAAVSNDLTLSRAIAEATNDGWVMTFIAFLQSNSEHSPKSGEAYSQAEISDMYQTWCKKHYNLPVRVRIGPDVGTVYTVINVTVDNTNLSGGATTMGRFISRAYDTLNDTSGWTIGEKVYVNRVRKRYFYENISLTSML